MASQFLSPLSRVKLFNVPDFFGTQSPGLDHYFLSNKGKRISPTGDGTEWIDTAAGLIIWQVEGKKTAAAAIRQLSHVKCQTIGLF